MATILYCRDAFVDLLLLWLPVNSNIFSVFDIKCNTCWLTLVV